MRSRHFIPEQELFEINMSPGNLKQLASKIDARVGMEFEMIVPGIESDDYNDYGEMEPDYNNNERVRGWDSIEQFFYDNDYNSRRSVDRLKDILFEKYLESDYWQEAEESWWEENQEYYVEQAVEKKLGEELWTQAAEQLGDKKFADRRDRENAIQEIYNNLVSERKDESIENRDEIYRLARDKALVDSEPDHDRGFHLFLRGAYDTMLDIENQFGDIVTWPHWTEREDHNDIDTDIGTVANNFSPYVNMKVDYSKSYHGAKRRPDTYVVEPDSSLSGDNEGDVGLEFVSPPLTLEQMGEHLEAVREFARDHACYTNKSTGLHINVSVPNMSMDNLDYIKLTLLLGDQYVLEQFGRSANTFCQSAMTEIIRRSKQNLDQIPSLLDMMKSGLNKMASKIIHSGSTNKYTSINTKDQYIEFRSPGGDWLSQDLDKIVATMNRFVVALDAAVDPEKYKEEYSKKLYKIIAPQDADDTIKYFAKYAAGSMPKTALKSFLKQARLQRQTKQQTNKKNPGNVTVPDNDSATRQNNTNTSPSQNNIEPSTQMPARRQDGSLPVPALYPNAGFAIIRASDNAVIDYIIANNRTQAAQQFTEWLEIHGQVGNPNYYIIALRP